MRLLIDQQKDLVFDAYGGGDLVASMRLLIDQQKDLRDVSMRGPMPKASMRLLIDQQKDGSPDKYPVINELDATMRAAPLRRPGIVISREHRVGNV